MNPETNPMTNAVQDVHATLSKSDPRFVKAASNAVELWQVVVTDVVRKSRGLKPEDVVTLPDGNEGRYIAFAFDNQGRLSMGKGHGRRKVRFKTHQAAKQKMTMNLFGGYLASKFKEAQAQAAKDGVKDIGQFSQADFEKAQKWAVRKAEVLTNAPTKAARKAANLRSRISRRINAGVIPGNSDRRSHSAA